MAAAASSEQPALPDEVTEDILLRLDAAADVARAAAACRAHLRVVRDRRFLLRFRSLRPPPVLGFFASASSVWHHVPSPELRLHHSSAAAARAVARAGDFAFSFLPSDPAAFTNWKVRDVRDGRVLLSRRRRDLAGAGAATTFLDLAVCDPLHRRYVLIPTIPDELVLKRYSAEMGSEPFFAAATRKEEDEVVVEESNQFQVIYNWMSSYKIDTFVFSSDTGKWRAATSFSLLPSRLIQDPRGLLRYHAGTCFYWVHYHGSTGYMLVLDELQMQFSIVSVPFYDKRARAIAFFDGGVQGLGAIVLRSYVMELELYYKKNNGGAGGAEEWRRDNSRFIPLPVEHAGYNYDIIAAAEGCFILEGTKYKERPLHFIVDLKTFLVERWFISPSTDGVVYHARLYANYPPLLSAPSI